MLLREAIEILVSHWDDMSQVKLEVEYREIIHTTMYAVTEPDSPIIAVKFSHHFDSVVARLYFMSAC